MALHPRRSDLKRYWVAVLLVLTATALTIAVKPLFEGKAPLVFFTIAVILSAGYGGIGTGLLTIALSVAVALSLFQDHVLVLVMAHSSLTLFAVIGVAITVVIGKLRGLNAAMIEARDQLAVANKELELANEKLLQHTETLSHSNQELQRFAYALAHDLQTPLRSIGALTDLLMGRNAEKLDESSKECARLIVNGVHRMESMIRGLLDYAAAVDSHDDQVVTDCNAVVEHVLEDFRYPIATSGILIRFEPLPAVQVNENHLVQLFLNLIGNAIKYRSALQPQIHISVKDQGADWMFMVKDNGIGLDMRHAEEIFGMFKRLHSSNDYEGSGVGLALCKAVIRRHGGKIWVESEPGKGSTFFFTLPKTGASEIRRKPAVVEQIPPRIKKAAT